VYAAEVTLAERLAAELGAEAVETEAGRLRALAVDGLVPAVLATPSSQSEVAQAVAAVEDAGAALIPRGSGTHVHVGNPPERYDVALCTRRLARVVRHEAADMTVTVEAGVTLAELAAALRPAGQWLPLDPPRPAEVTVGGLVAADLNGSLRLAHGKVRDYLLGVRAVVGGGTLVRGGGQVVKNVAGYDLPKLLIGSCGTLGVIVEATFKVRPLPAAQMWLAGGCDTLALAGERALALLDGPLAPYAVDVCDARAASSLGLPPRAHVLVRLGGEVAEVQRQRQRLHELLPDAEEVADAVAGAAPELSLTGAVSARLSLLPGDLAARLEAIEREARAFGVETRLLAHAGSGVLRLQIEAAQSPLPYLHWLRFLARQHGGHLFVERLPAEHKREIDVWGEPPAPLELQRRVKQALDPRLVFSPGRFAGRL
jgi:glycolate oxidase FAD binding subunit